jgi:osmotically-inducible protein OsmY
MSKLTRFLSCAFTVAFIACACASNEKDEAQQTVQKIEDKTKEVAGEVADKSKEIVSATGEAITDGWITAKVKAKFADEKLLKDSKIDIDAKDRVLTLKGTVASAEAKKRAVAVANGTEGVLSVVDQLAIRK